jgi:hypothetical protein
LVLKKLHYSLWFEGYLSQTVTLDGILQIGNFSSIKESVIQNTQKKIKDNILHFIQ